MRTSHVVTFLAACAIVAMGLLTVSVRENKADQAAIAAVAEVKPHAPGSTFEPRASEWGKLYPREYSTYMQTRQSDELLDVAEKLNSGVVINWAGYAFAWDYSKPRGHFYMLEDNQNSLRTGAPNGADVHSNQPTTCWTCKSPDVPRLMERDGELEYYTGPWDKYGSEVVNPVACADCHNPKTMELVVTRPYLKKALDAEGTLKYANATHQDMRSLVCAQCHNEYFFVSTKWNDPKTGEEKEAKVVTLPWDKGFSVEAMEKYYDEKGYKDFEHKLSKAPILKAQHPDYELFRTSIHFQRGLSCADCHMPYVREGGVKFTSHNVLGNPLDQIGVVCLNCHKESESEFRKLIGRKLERKMELGDKLTNVLATAHLEAKRAWELGATQEEMDPALQAIRKGQWRWDYAMASHGAFFHAPEEMLRILGAGLDFAQEARVTLRSVLTKYGEGDYQAPDFSTKEKALAAAGLDELVAGKIGPKKAFLDGLKKEWFKEAEKKGVFDPKTQEGMVRKTSY